LYALTGFRPHTSLDEIIDRVTAFFRDAQRPAAKMVSAD
jgi:hypothetical protein